MGTRSVTKVMENDACVLALYRQFDGYPDGHGAELATFLDGMTIVNGFTSRDAPKTANGMGCLAAQLVAHFKKEIGGFYLQATSVTDAGQNYDYVVSMLDGVLCVQCPRSYSKESLYLGDVAGFKVFCARQGDNQ